LLNQFIIKYKFEIIEEKIIHAIIAISFSGIF
ncbi:MAG: hypothetical protein RLZZ418_151, partial [Pseudomonadota bacterium]